MEFFHTPVDWHSLSLDPIALAIGPFVLRWYSLAYIVGILAGWYLLSRMIRKPASPMVSRQLDDLVTWATIGVILGGRIGYVLFYDLPAYAQDPLAVFRLWEGGMSFHGGFIGVVLATFLFARRQKLLTLRILDYLAVVTPLGLLLGRLANFVNGELWGRPTDGQWGIIFPDAGPLPRHPSQLYEAALEGVALFVLLNMLFWLSKARRLPGLLSGLFVAGYGVSRFVVEYFREPDAQLGTLSFGLTMGQTLSLPLILAGLYLLATANRRPVAL